MVDCPTEPPGLADYKPWGDVTGLWPFLSRPGNSFSWRQDSAGSVPRFLLIVGCKRRE